MTDSKFNGIPVKIYKVIELTRLVAMAALLVIISLAACAPPKPVQQFTLRIGFLSTQDSLPYFVMREQGFDKKNGLRFEEKEYPSGGLIIDAIAAGSLDISSMVGSVPVLQATERGVIPDKVLSIAANNFADPDHQGVGVLAGNSVNGWKDLKGKQVGVVSATSLHGAAIKGRLLKEGVSDYTLVEIPFANLGLAVAGGNIAAATMSEPYLTQSLLRKDGKFLGWIIGGPPFERFEFTMILCSSILYRNNPQVIKSFLRTHLQAVEWIENNQDKARRILAVKLNLSPEVGDKMSRLRLSPDGRNDPILLESMQPLLVQTGMLKAPIPVNQLYDETLLNEILAEKR